jgi:hypothetical protein
LGLVWRAIPEPPLAAAGQCSHHPIRRNSPNAIIATVSYINHPLRVRGHISRRVELRLPGRAVAVARFPIPGQGAHRPVGGDDSDAVIVGVGHVHVPIHVHRNTMRVVELRYSAGSIRVARGPSSSQSGHHPVWINTPYPVSKALGNVDVPFTVNGHAAFNPIEACLVARAVAVAPVAVACQGGNGYPLHVEEAVGDHFTGG